MLNVPQNGYAPLRIIKLNRDEDGFIIPTGVIKRFAFINGTYAHSGERKLELTRVNDRVSIAENTLSVLDNILTTDASEVHILLYEYLCCPEVDANGKFIEPPGPFKELSDLKTINETCMRLDDRRIYSIIFTPYKHDGTMYNYTEYHKLNLKIEIHVKYGSEDITAEFGDYGEITRALLLIPQQESGNLEYCVEFGLYNGCDTSIPTHNIQDFYVIAKTDDPEYNGILCDMIVRDI